LRIRRSATCDRSGGARAAGVEEPARSGSATLCG
jgi:hypothetical protein